MSFLIARAASTMRRAHGTVGISFARGGHERPGFAGRGIDALERLVGVDEHTIDIAAEARERHGQPRFPSGTPASRAG